MEQQEQQKVELIEITGIVKEEIYRKRSPYTKKRDECQFYLESGEDIWCEGFIPDIRKRWIVKVIGFWSESRTLFLAEKVIHMGSALPLPKKLPKEQLKLEVFEK